jgi:hypothetical protein
MLRTTVAAPAARQTLLEQQQLTARAAGAATVVRNIWQAALHAQLARIWVAVQHCWSNSCCVQLLAPRYVRMRSWELVKADMHVGQSQMREHFVNMQCVSGQNGIHTASYQLRLTRNLGERRGQ